MVDNNICATQPFDENNRLAELHALDILDTPAEVRFDHYTHLLAQIFKVPIAIVSLVDEDRLWFKSSVGMEVREMPRVASFCGHVLEQGVLEVTDALEDDFFRHHPLVVGSPFIRFYAGTVLRGPTGQPLGALCIIDTSPRNLTEIERFWLVTFGHLVEELIKHDARLAKVRQRVNQLTNRNTCTGLAGESLFGVPLTNLINLADKDDRYLAILQLRLSNLDESVMVINAPHTNVRTPKSRPIST